MEYHDYYQTLGVPRDASQADIKKAFRRLAREHHPDRQGGDKSAEKRFKEINEANAVLSDPEKRKKYDVLGANWEALSRAGADARASGRDPFAGRDPFGGFGGFGDGGNVRYEFRTSGDAGEFSDFFRVFFGGQAAGGAGSAGSAGGGRARRGGAGPTFEDILSELGLDRGAAGGGGAGRFRPAGGSARGAPSGGGATTTAARPGTATAEAVAEISLDEAFHGTTRRVEIDGRRLDVTIPRGADTGTRVKLSGQGPAGGDLVVVVRVAPHPVFTRRGADLERELPLRLGEAVLGAEVPVTTLKGRVLLRIPAGTQSGHRFRLTGQGMPRLRGDGTGDLYARARVVLPTDLDPAQEAAARTFLDLVDQPDPRD